MRAESDCVSPMNHQRSTKRHRIDGLAASVAQMLAGTLVLVITGWTVSAQEQASPTHDPSSSTTDADASANKFLDGVTVRPKPNQASGQVRTLEAQLSFWSANEDFFFLTTGDRGVRVRRSNSTDQVLRGCKLGTPLLITIRAEPRKREWLAVRVEALSHRSPPSTVPAGIGFGEARARYSSFAELHGRVGAAMIDQNADKTIIQVRADGGEATAVIAKAVSPDIVETWVGREVNVTGVLRRIKSKNLRGAKSKLLLMDASQLSASSQLPVMLDAMFPLQRHVGRLVFREGNQRGVLIEQNRRDPILVSSPYVTDCSLNENLEIRCAVEHSTKSKALPIPAYVIVRSKSETTTNADLGVIGRPANNLVEFSGTVKHVSEGSGCREVMLAAADGSLLPIAVEAADELDIDQLSKLRLGNVVRGSGVGVELTSSLRNASTLPHRKLDPRNAAERQIYLASLDGLTVIRSPIELTRQTLWLAGAAIFSVLIAALTWTQLLRRQVDSRTRDLRNVASQMELAFNTVREGILISEKDGSLTQVNRRFEDIFGFTPTPVAGVNVCLDRIGAQFLFPDQFETFRRTLSNRKFNRLEAQLVEPPRTVQIYTNVMQVDSVVDNANSDSSSAMQQRLWAFDDVTTQRRLEDELLQSQKMEIVGQLSGGVAHDFNNLLTVMRASLTMISRRSRDEMPALVEYTSTAKTAIDRAAVLTDQLLHFSRRNTLNRQTQDLHAIVGDACALVIAGSPDSIQIKQTLSAEPLNVDADAPRLEQVIVNLLLNARDAMLPAGGTIRVVTGVIGGDRTDSPRPIVAAADPLSWTSNSEFASQVFIDVEDDGVGMTDDQQDRVFEPFFTTKPSGVGTGLGLSMAHGVITQHGGSISCESTIDSGSTFRVLLPKIDGSEPPTDSALVSDNSEPGPQRIVTASTSELHQNAPLHILLVDDLPMVRGAEESLLAELGHTVESVGSGSRAIEILSAGNDYDLMLLDLSMPDIDGTQVFNLAMKFRPSLPIVICTGRLDEARRHAVFQHAPRRPVFLPKPHTIEQLQARISDAIESVKVDMPDKSSEPRRSV